MATGSVAQGKINAEIILKLDSLATGLSKVDGMISGFNTKTAAQSQKSAKATSAAWMAGFALISMYVLKMAKKVTAAFGDMINVYAQFEQSLANTQSVARASAEELDAMERAARRVGATTRSTASEAADALYYLASAGFSASESIAALDGVNALAIATQSDLASTSETVATTIRQYGLETSAATDIANTFTAAITNSLATMNKLAKSFEYVGPIAAGLGITVEETTGALQLLYNKGFSGEKAGRGLRSILVDLADSTSVVNRKLGELNISFDQVNPATNDLADIFDTLRENGVSAANAAAIFGKVSGVQLASLISVASNAKGGMVELTDAVTGTNRAFEAMDIQMDTLQGSIDKFKNAEEALKITIGKQLDPVLTTIVDTFTTLIKTINKLPPPLLAAITTIAAIAAVSTIAAVAVVALNVAAVAAVGSLAAAASAIAAIAVPLTVIGVAGAAAVAVFDRIEKTKFDEVKSEFKSLSSEAELTKDDLEVLYSYSDELRGNFKAIFSDTKDIEGMKKEVEDLAEAYDLTSEKVLAIAKADSKLDNGYKKRIAMVTELFRVDKGYRDYQAIRSAEDLKNSEVQFGHMEQMAKYKKEAILQSVIEKEQQKAFEDSTKTLTVAFDRAKEMQKAFGDEFDRNAYLTDIFNGSIKKLINEGLAWEDEEIQHQIKLYQDLQDQTEKVSAAGLTDAQKNIAAQKELRETLAQITQEKELANKTGKDYNDSLKKSEAVQATINGLIKEGFTVQGGAIQQILKLFGDLIIKGGEYNIVLDEYKDKLERLKASKMGLIDLDEKAAIVSANSKNATQDDLDAITDYFEQLRENERKAQYTALDLTDKLNKLTKSNKELIEEERERAHTSIESSDLSRDAMNDLIVITDKYFDKLKEKAAFDEFIDNFSNVVDKIQDFTGAIDDFIQASIQNQIDKENELLQTKLSALDIAEEAELISLGLLEKTALEKAQDKINAAIATGDAIALVEAQDAYDRLVIQQDYDAQRAILEDASAKRMADLKYKADLSAWAANSIQAISSSALAIIEAYTTPGVGIAAGVAMSALTALQLATIAMNRPKPPEFANGGVIPGSSYKGDSTPVLANAGEVILNQAQQENVANQLGNDQPISITVNSILDGKVVATNSAKYYRNGQVKL